MFEVKQSICYPGFGVRISEDVIGYGKNYCFVMDGASCLSGKISLIPFQTVLGWQKRYGTVCVHYWTRTIPALHGSCCNK